MASDQYTQTSALTVIAAAVSGISIKTQPQLNYIAGNTLNLSALEVTLTYNDGDTRDVAFADPNEYERDCVAGGNAMRQILRPFARVTDKNAKSDKKSPTNRVNFVKNHVSVLCADGSYLASDTPNLWRSLIVRLAVHL